MKITIEPTEPVVPGGDSAGYPAVAITMPDDSLDITDAMDMVRSALIAWGYSEMTVDACLNGED